MLQVISEKAEQDVTIRFKKGDITGDPTFKTSYSRVISSDYVIPSKKVRVVVTMVTCYVSHVFRANTQSRPQIQNIFR